jgi:hypothetical protein
VLTIAIVAFVLWLLGMIFLKTAKAFIHILLLVAIAVAVFHFVGR